MLDSLQPPVIMALGDLTPSVWLVTCIHVCIHTDTHTYTLIKQTRNLNIYMKKENAMLGRRQRWNLTGPLGLDSKIENDLQGRQSHGVVGQMDLNNR